MVNIAKIYEQVTNFVRIFFLYANQRLDRNYTSFADSQNKIKRSKRMFGNFDIKNIEAATRLVL